MFLRYFTACESGSDELDNKVLSYFYGEPVTDDMDSVEWSCLSMFLTNYLTFILDKYKSEFCPQDNIPKKKSLLDDYDQEEGYNDLEPLESPYKAITDTIKYFIKYLHMGCHTSVNEAYNMNVYDFIDFIKFDIDYNEEHKNE